MQIRNKLINVRVTEMELELARRVAASERMPLTTMVRRNLMLQAERQGIYPPVPQLVVKPPKNEA